MSAYDDDDFDYGHHPEIMRLAVDNLTGHWPYLFDSQDLPAEYIAEASLDAVAVFLQENNLAMLVKDRQVAFVPRDSVTATPITPQE